MLWDFYLEREEKDDEVGGREGEREGEGGGQFEGSDRHAGGDSVD